MFLDVITRVQEHTEYTKYLLCIISLLPGGSGGKESAFNVGDLGSIPRSGRSPGEGNGNPLQYSCLENSIDGGAGQAAVHGIAKSQTRLCDVRRNCVTNFHFHYTKGV